MYLISIFQRVAQVFKNERDLEADAKRLQAAAAVYQKQCKDWLDMVDQFDNALKVKLFLHLIGEGSVSDNSPPM